MPEQDAELIQYVKSKPEGREWSKLEILLKSGANVNTEVKTTKVRLFVIGNMSSQESRNVLLVLYVSIGRYARRFGGSDSKSLMPTNGVRVPL